MSETKAKPFNSRKMYVVGCGNVDKCTFDFSIISNDEYSGFFGGLPNFVYKKCKSVTFCNDFYYNYKKDGRHSKRRESIIEASIMYQHPKYLQYLVKIIKNVVPGAKSLEKIEFSNMKIPKKFISSISHAIGNSQTIKEVSFSDVPLGDESLAELLGSLSPYQIKTITLNNTGITTRATNMVEEFLKKQPRSSNIDHTIESINISQENFPEEEIEAIKDMIQRYKDNDEDWDEGRQWASRLIPQTDVYDSIRSQASKSIHSKHEALYKPKRESKERPSKVDDDQSLKNSQANQSDEAQTQRESIIKAVDDEKEYNSYSDKKSKAQQDEKQYSYSYSYDSKRSYSVKEEKKEYDSQHSYSDKEEKKEYDSQHSYSDKEEKKEYDSQHSYSDKEEKKEYDSQHLYSDKEEKKEYDSQHLYSDKEEKKEDSENKEEEKKDDYESVKEDVHSGSENEHQEDENKDESGKEEEKDNQEQVEEKQVEEKEPESVKEEEKQNENDIPEQAEEKQEEEKAPESGNEEKQEDEGEVKAESDKEPISEGEKPTTTYETTEIIEENEERLTLVTDNNTTEEKPSDIEEISDHSQDEYSLSSEPKMKEGEKQED